MSRDGALEGAETETQTMAIAVYFSPKNLTLADYEEVNRRLAEAGHRDSPHRLHHSGFGADGEMAVYEIWDSPESFEAFGAVLMPILAEVGIDPGEPAVMPIQKLVQTAADE
jgi:hypothetical protein